MTRVIETLEAILEIAPDTRPQKGAERSPEWDDVRDAFVKEHPKCAVCSSHKDLQVHHVIPFEFGGDELNPDNLITLCVGTFNCHLLFGHLGDFRSFNPLVRSDADQWNFRFRARRMLTRMAKKELKIIRELQTLETLRRNQNP